jgi:hypothetical protein
MIRMTANRMAARCFTTRFRMIGVSNALAGIVFVLKRGLPGGSWHREVMVLRRKMAVWPQIMLGAGRRHARARRA